MRAIGAVMLVAASLLVSACGSPSEANPSEGSESGEAGDGDPTGDGDGDGDGDPDPGGVSCADEPNQTTITTTRGPVAGVAQAGVTRFLAIPYAAAPIGELRFRPPQPAEPWNDPRDASSPGPVCVQLLADPGQSGGEPIVGGEEDCLQLNVWTPQACEGADLPVLLFIHGGGNATGSGTDPLYDGAKLAAAAEAVVVTINYRLGALGWLAHDALDSEDPDGVSGNYGLRDQLAALDWVAENVARFGGDPERVTVFGESAGAVNTCALIGAPAAEGRFAGAIVQSGTCSQPSRALVEPLATELLASAGCAALEPAEVPGCLRAIPAAELVAMAPTGYPNVAGIGRGWGPHVDGELLPETTLDALASGRPGVPFVVGSNRDETARDVPPGLDAASYEALVQASFLGFAPQVLAAYPLADYADPAAAYIALTTDFKFICNARRAAVASASGGAPTWRYQFSYDGYTTLPGSPTSAFHGLELVFLFGNYDSLLGGAEYPPNAEDLSIAASLQDRWGGFAATGEFEGPAYEPGADPYVELDVPIGAGEGLRTAQCDFWDNLF